MGIDHSWQHCDAHSLSAPCTAAISGQGSYIYVALDMVTMLSTVSADQ